MAIATVGLKILIYTYHIGVYLRLFLLLFSANIWLVPFRLFAPAEQYVYRKKVCETTALQRRGMSITTYLLG